MLIFKATRFSETNKPAIKIPAPPTNPNVHVENANVAIAFLGMELANPQKVTGPPAAAVNSKVAAGASPIPNNSNKATNGISKSNGTLIKIPNVAATATPRTSFPKYVETASGLNHCIASPLANPANTITGPIRIRNLKLVLTHSRKASRIAGNQGSGTTIVSTSSSNSEDEYSSSGFLVPRSTTYATKGPTRITAVIPRINLLIPRIGVNTSAAITRPGTLSVEEPCNIARAPSIPTPCLWNDDETGTIQAEHKFITGPTIKPFSDLRILPPERIPTPLLRGNKNASDRPATVKAKSIPSATNCKYVKENFHQRSRRVESSSLSIQNP